jgi:hypothetical protein
MKRKGFEVKINEDVSWGWKDIISNANAILLEMDSRKINTTSIAKSNNEKVLIKYILEYRKKSVFPSNCGTNTKETIRPFCEIKELGRPYQIFYSIQDVIKEVMI